MSDAVEGAAPSNEAATTTETKREAAATPEAPPAEAIAGPDDPRVKAAEAESKKQEQQAALAEVATNAMIVEPQKDPHDAVVAVLGEGAKPTGYIRTALQEGVDRRVQMEWADGRKAAWFDIPTVVVDYLPPQ